MNFTKDFIDFRLGDGVSGMASILSGSVNVVLVDPPYLYLKGQKLEREFDEFLYFSKVKRVLRDDGFLVIFGRGASFYRWNNMLESLGFKFKEEIIWDKGHTSSPAHSISRVHETVAIWSKKNGKINRAKVPYTEAKGHDIPAIISDIKRLKTTYKNTKSFDAVMNYLETGLRTDYAKPEQGRKNDIVRSGLPTGDRACNVMQSMHEGLKEKSLIVKKEKHNATLQPSAILSEDRAAHIARMFQEGMNEKTVIKSVRDHFNSFHPTQKPVALLKRLLNLVAKPGDTCIDNFAGSGSSGEACADLEINWIGWEIDQEFWQDAIDKRFNKMLHKQLELL